MLRVFRHYIPKTLVFLAVIELLVLMLSIYLGVEIRFEGKVDTSPEGIGPLFPKAITFALVMIGSMTAMGLYQRHLRDQFWGMSLRIIASFVVGFLAMGIVFYLIPDLFLGRGAIGYSFLFGLIGVMLVRTYFTRVVDQEARKTRILVLGTGVKAASIGHLLRRKADRREFTIVGYVYLSGQGKNVDDKDIIAHDTSLLELARQYQIGEIVVAIDDRRKSFPMHEVVDCRMSGIEVSDLLSFFERQSGRIMIDQLNPSWLIYSDGFRYGAFRVYSKRVFDITVSLLLLLATWPVMALAALAILIDNRWQGPILYRQVRVGQNWKLFQVLKFRSMITNAEQDGVAKWASENDSRVTRVGSFLRKTRIDELPQIFNVLKGDMSFVGPRPERPMFVETLSENIPYYAERHRVKPGITGWAQICYPYGASEKDATEKLQYDLYYVKNYSLFLDLMILFQTAQVILWGKGAR